MAGYATAAEIQSEFKDTDFTAGTAAVTSAELDDWSDQFSRMLDTYLATKYDTPITGSPALETVTLLVRGWVAARAARILNATTGIGESELNKAIALEDLAEKWLKDFKDGCINLKGATVLTNIGSPTSYNEKNSIDPTWEKGVDQW